MTLEDAEDRPPEPGRARRADQGDLWAPDEGAPDVAAPPAATHAPARSTPRAPARQEPQPEPPPPEPAYTQPALTYDDEDDDFFDYEQPSALSNPYVLAALAVAGAIILAVAVVFLFGRGNDSPPGTSANATLTPAAATPGGPEVTGLLAKSIAVSTVREGPALNHLELGTLPANQDVDVVGRNEESTWFLIVFPPQTDLRGWVPETALRLPNNVESLVAVAEATSVPRPDVPTATTAPQVEATATPSSGRDGPDLAVSMASDCAPGSAIVVGISNAGTEALDNALIEVIVSRNSIVEYQQPFQAAIPVGASAQLNTGVQARAPQMSVIVNLQELDDVDPSNNSASCQVQAAPPNNNNNSNVPPVIPTPGTQR